MSIYATLWTLKFPKEGDACFGCDWIKVTAQAVPAHIGSPTPGCGYEDGDPYSGPNGAQQLSARQHPAQSHAYRSSISTPCFRHNARNSS